MLSYRITTLGCRVNHAESRDIESVLLARGLRRAPDRQPADLEVVHTCSVTQQAAAKSRNAVRRAIRRQHADDDDHGHAEPANWRGPRPSPTVLVTGCYAGTNTEEAASITNDRDHVIPQSEDDGSSMIDRFVRQVDRWLAEYPSLQTSIRPAARDSSTRTLNGTTNHDDADRSNSESIPVIRPLPVVEPQNDAGSHIRAELRIQDGCDAHCTFCIIPKIRLSLRSKTVADAVDEARRLVDAGHLEIVLTGIFIGAYGHETALRRKQHHRHVTPLADLLDAVAQVPGLERLRISSMEPGDVTQPLLDAMLDNAPTVVPHLHLPLQSGSDAILAKMNRQYRVGDYLEMIDQVNDTLTQVDEQGWALPPAITTDIICGFPGETQDDFEQTVNIAERVGYLHMHVFPFSSKPGTAAARWTNKFVPNHIVKKRVRRLIDLENDPENGFSIQYRRNMLGQTTRMIVEQTDHQDPTLKTGRCDHYALLTARTNAPRGTVLPVKIIDLTPEHTFAEPLPTRVSLPVASAS